MTSTKDGNNNTTSYQYDGVLAAYRTAVTNALGQATHTAYSDYWNIASITDPNDAVTAFTHDDFGRPTSITRPLDQTYANNVEYSYSLGSPRSLVRVDVLRVAVGTLGPIRRDTYYQTAWWFYDGLGRVIQQQAQGADGSIILANTAYDPMGRVQRVSDPYDPAVASGQTAYLYHALVPELYGGAGGAAPTPTPTPSFQGGTYVPADWRRPATAYQYDALGRPVATLYADGTSSTTAYNQLTTTFTDANGHRKDTVSDKFGRTVAVNEYHDSATLSTTYGYDVMDNLRFVVDSGGAGMGYEYDQLGRKTASSDADMGDWTYDYDHAGNVIQQTDAMGQRTCLYYDPLNRLVGKKYQSSGTNCPGDPGAYDVTNTYDQGDNGIGHRTSMNDRSGSTAWQYDAEGRLTAQTESINGAPEAYTTTWTYDEMDRPLSMTYPDGESVPMTYNSQGLVATLGGYVTGSSYNPAGQPLELDFGDGTQTNYAYNPLNRRLTQLQTAGGASAIQNLSYDYDNVGNITQITDAVRNEVTTFGYDDLDRLTSASIAGVYSHAWQYDSTGNIIQRTEDSTPVTYTYGDNEHQPHAVTAVGARTFDYDANGDMIRRAGDELTYDEENRLTRVVAAGVTSVFTYDGDGNRVKKEVGSGGTTTTFYVGNYYEVTGTTATKYYYFGTLRVAMKQGDAVTYLHGDNLGSTSVTSGATVSAQTYYAFGAIRTTTGVVPTDFGFTGQRFDSDAGLMYYNARYYDATIGRFIQPDTVIPDLFDPQSLNRYTYVRNDPVRYTDPSGHFVPLLAALFAPEVIVPVAFVAAAVIASYPLVWAPNAEENRANVAAAMGRVGGTVDAGIDEIMERGRRINLHLPGPQDKKTATNKKAGAFPKQAPSDGKPSAGPKVQNLGSETAEYEGGGGPSLTGGSGGSPRDLRWWAGRIIAVAAGLEAICIETTPCIEAEEGALGVRPEGEAPKPQGPPGGGGGSDSGRDSNSDRSSSQSSSSSAPDYGGYDPLRSWVFR